MLLGSLIGHECLTPDFPNLLSLGPSVQKLLVRLGLALFAEVLNIFKIFVKNAHADADIVLPDVAKVARDPWVLGVLWVDGILASGAADAADDLFFLLFRLRLRIGLSLVGFLAAATLGLEGLVERIGGALVVLALGAADRPSRLRLTHGCETDGNRLEVGFYKSLRWGLLVTQGALGGDNWDSGLLYALVLERAQGNDGDQRAVLL